MLPKGLRHRLQQNTRCIWKAKQFSSLLFSYHRTLNIQEVSHFLNEFGRISGSREFSPSHALANWIQIMIGCIRAGAYILFQKNISSHLPPRPSPWFPVVSNEKNIYCILLWVLSWHWSLPNICQHTFSEISTSASDVCAKGTSSLSNAAWLCCLGQQNMRKTSLHAGIPSILAVQHRNSKKEFITLFFHDCFQQNPYPTKPSLKRKYAPCFLWAMRCNEPPEKLWGHFDGRGSLWG